MLKLPRQTKRFIRNEDGIATAWAIGWLILCFAIAGLSIDATNAWKVKQILQSTADVSAHAGGLELGTVGNSEIEAAVIVAANQYATENMNVARYGDVLVDNDIQTGTWNRDTHVFAPLPAGSISPPNAVRVTTRQDGVNSSRVGTFFLRFIGFDAFSVSTSATVERFLSQCERDGLMARGVVDMSTQQAFLGKYCVHGENGIGISQDNYFELGTTASMFNLDNCMPNPTHCDDEANEGIEAALRQNSMTFGKVDRIPQTIESYKDPYWLDQPDYITNMTVNTISDIRNFDAATQLEENTVNVIDCGRAQGNQGVSLGAAATVNNNGNGTDSGDAVIPPDLVFNNIVIVGIDCDFVFDPTITYEDAIIATSATGRQTFSGAAGITLGKDDNCDPGGELALITAGDVHFAAKLDAYDLEMVVAGDVHLASHANSAESIHEGTSVWAGGDIKVTTKHTFTGCGDSANSPTVDAHYTLRYVE